MSGLEESRREIGPSQPVVQQQPVPDRFRNQGLNLASFVLTLALSHLGNDWETEFTILPRMVESFVDP